MLRLALRVLLGRKLALFAVAAAVAALPALGGDGHPAAGSLAPGGAKDPRPDLATVQRRSLVKIGFTDLGGRGFNGDLWGHGAYVYAGTWGLSEPGLCLGIGVKIVDVSDPLNPQHVRTTAVAPGSRASEVQAEVLNTASFNGHLLVNSNEACAANGFNGIQLWDVSDPLNPVELSRFPTGPVHNFYLFQRGDRAYVLLAVPYAEVFGPSRGYPASDLQIVDVTDPSNPVLAGQWTIGRDAGLAFGSPFFTDPALPPRSNCAPPPGTPALCRGDIPAVYLHDVWASSDGMTAYLSYWDAGAIILNIANVAAPAMIGRAVEPVTFGSNEGSTHSAVPNAAGNLLLVADEDFDPGPWGFLRIFDISNPASPVQVSAFATLRTLQDPPPDFGWYTIHHPMVQGNTAYIGWYSDGVRVVDFSQPTSPKELASYVPPNTADPNGVLPANPFVWSAHPNGQAVLASDMNAGLYLLAYDNDGDGCADLQETSDVPGRGGRRDPSNFWDFFDTPAGNPPRRDRIVSVSDIAALVGRFGSTGDPSVDPLSDPPPAPAYHPGFDRTFIPGSEPWDTAPPDGRVTVLDISLSVQQFGHSCA